MYTPLQLDMIRIFGKKNLSFGCLVKAFNKILKFSHTVYHTQNEFTDYIFIKEDGGLYHLGIYQDEHILGHIPTLEDIIRVIEGNKYNYRRISIPREKKELEIWEWSGDCQSWDCTNIEYDPKISPLEQSKDTMEQLLNLFK